LSSDGGNTLKEARVSLEKKKETREAGERRTLHVRSLLLSLFQENGQRDETKVGAKAQEVKKQPTKQ